MLFLIDTFLAILLLHEMGLFMSDRFYTPQPIGVGEFILDGPESHHLTTVRRFGIGDRVVMFNGNGHEYMAEIIAVNRKQVMLNVVSVQATDRELDFELVIASAMPKGDRGEYLIEKLTELGVTRFVPLITSRSVVTPKDSSVEKYQRGVIEASKQCGRNRLMAVDLPVTWAEFLRSPSGTSQRYVLHTQLGNDGLQHRPITALTHSQNVTVAVGPEGGFTTAEIDAAVHHGYKVLSCGPRVLRVETAATAIAAWLGLNRISNLAFPDSERLP